MALWAFYHSPHREDDNDVLKHTMTKKELTSNYQTSTLELMYSQLASRRKTACCTIASLTQYSLFQQSEASRLLEKSGFDVQID